jgi:hypothetical protein
MPWYHCHAPSARCYQCGWSSDQSSQMDTALTPWSSINGALWATLSICMSLFPCIIVWISTIVISLLSFREGVAVQKFMFIIVHEPFRNDVCMHVLHAEFDAGRIYWCPCVCVIVCDGSRYDSIFRHHGAFRGKWSVYTVRLWEGMNFLVYWRRSLPQLYRSFPGVDRNEANKWWKIHLVL